MGSTQGPLLLEFGEAQMSVDGTQIGIPAG